MSARAKAERSGFGPASPDGFARGPRAALLWLCLCALLGGCKSTSEKQLEAFYGPTESILEVVAILRRHVPDDTYRFAPATDFTGRNVYRASLLRLENLEQIHEAAIRSGYMEPVIAFAKARALERLRAYDLAEQHYREVARYPGTLSEIAASSAAVCADLAAAAATGIDIVNPLAESVDAGQLGVDATAVVAELDERVRLLSDIYERGRDTHYAYIAREEIERADLARARYFVALRFVLPDGQIRAVSELQRVLSRHAPSKNRRRHLIELGNFYATLAREYVASTPPTSLNFDPPRFQELVTAATDLYRSVSTMDGTPEKLEAGRLLEAFLAFSLTIDRDRFTQ